PTHYGLARAVLASGRHLLIEKPVDLDPARIDDLATAAREAGVLAMPAHCMRFWPAWSWMKTRLDDETYGRCRRVSLRRCGAAPTWNPSFYLDDARSGGAIVDLHIHDTDFLVHCFGSPRVVHSSGSRRYVKTVYEYPDGPEVVAEGGWLSDEAAGFRMEARCECDRGTITFDLSREVEILVEGPGGVIQEHPEASDGGTGYDGQAEALVDAIQNGATEPPVTLEEAAQTGRVLQAEIASIEAGGRGIEPGGWRH
ncbi:MAG: Gfo/Idh/MocA family oxidoreductase, partial [Planctomycetota bacterium]|nr:Gfo/Idh/MocA family oxidoreductase [Planctomycetota bacterium]